MPTQLLRLLHSRTGLTARCARALLVLVLLTLSLCAAADAAALLPVPDGPAAALRSFSSSSVAFRHETATYAAAAIPVSAVAAAAAAAALGFALLAAGSLHACLLLLWPAEPAELHHAAVVTTAASARLAWRCCCCRCRFLGPVVCQTPPRVPFGQLHVLLAGRVFAAAAVVVCLDTLRTTAVQAVHHRKCVPCKTALKPCLYLNCNLTNASETVC